jgi:hypothetical protein
VANLNAADFAVHLRKTCRLLGRHLNRAVHLGHILLPKPGLPRLVPSSRLLKLMASRTSVFIQADTSNLRVSSLCAAGPLEYFIGKSILCFNHDGFARNVQEFPKRTAICLKIFSLIKKHGDTV